MNQNILDVNNSESNEKKCIPSTNEESTTKIHSKRGRKSTVPREIREQTRRIKKQNIERSRRACIANQMTELHKLAMNLIGLEISEQIKIEKVDILRICYEVFGNVGILLNERPDLKEKLRQMCHSVQTKSLSKHQEVTDSNNNDNYTPANLYTMDTSIMQTQSSPIMYNNNNNNNNKENYNPNDSNILIPSELSAFTPIRRIKDEQNFEYHSTPIQLPSLTTDSGYFDTLYSSLSTPLRTTENTHSTHLQINSYTYPHQTYKQEDTSLIALQPKENILTYERSSITSSDSKDVWRPYLD
ncbi:unnamed protein product [Trichobilharzia regenti]|nr:unnamed protein product [Trichobilharzia regenti]